MNYARFMHSPLTPCLVHGCASIGEPGELPQDAIQREAALARPLRNPHDGSTNWYHGTSFNPAYDEDDEYAHEGGTVRPPSETGHGNDDMDGRANEHWNTDLGSHFTSLQRVAHGFAEHGDREHSRVLTAGLHMANPKHFDSEEQMANHAINWATKNGHRFLQGASAEDYDKFSDGRYGFNADEGDEDHEHLGEHMDHLHDQIGGTEHEIADIDHHGARARVPDITKERWLIVHPERESLTSGYVDHLRSQGHDGITYGNSFEGPNGHTCAIAFDDTPIHHRKWTWTDEGQERKHHDPAAREPQHIPGQTQMRFGPHPEGGVGLTAAKHTALVLDDFMPTERLFSPTKGTVDPILFGTDRHMLPEVREEILAATDEFFLDHGYGDPDGWARVYLAGSQASEWFGNRDFDILIGVNYDKLRKAHPQFDGMTVEQIDTQFNTQLRDDFNQPDWHPAFDPAQAWDRTGYVNPNSWNIADIKPYAAYNVTDDEWAVQPIHEPEGHRFEQSEIYYFEGVAAQARSALAMPEPLRTRRCSQIWEFVHSDRSRAFGPHGTGAFDRGNALEKYLDQATSPYSGVSLMQALANVRYGKPQTKTGMSMRDYDSKQMAFPWGHHNGQDPHEKSRVYVRFGDWPANERSTNYVTGHPEDGVSVYELNKHGDPIDPDGNMDRDEDMFGDPRGNDTHEEMRDRVHKAERAFRNGVWDAGNARAHLVTGDHAGFGHDDEPLLTNVKRVGDWIQHRHHFIPTAPKHPLALEPGSPADQERKEYIEHDFGQDLHLPGKEQKTAGYSMTRSSDPSGCYFYPEHPHEHESGDDEDCPYSQTFTNWSHHYPHLGQTLHRGMTAELHPDAHDESLPMHQRAHAALGSVKNGWGGVGTHWTTDENIARTFATGHEYGDKAPHSVVIHAHTPDRKHINTDPDSLRDGAVSGYDEYADDDNPGGNTLEREVPIHAYAPVKVHGVSWAKRDEDGEHVWQHHTFDQPVSRTAAAQPDPSLYPRRPLFQPGDKVMSDNYPGVVHHVEESEDAGGHPRIWVTEEGRDHAVGIHQSRVRLHPDASPESREHHARQVAKDEAGKPYVPQTERNIDENDRVTVHHLTGDPHFAPSTSHRPENNTTMGGDLSPRLFVGDPTTWAEGEYGYKRPYVAEMSVPRGAVHSGHGYSGEGEIHARNFDKVHVNRVIPYDAYDREKYGVHGRAESYHGTTFDTGKKITPEQQRNNDRGKRNFPAGYRWPGDTRDWSSEQHRQYVTRHNQYLQGGHGWDIGDDHEWGSQHEAVLRRHAKTAGAGGGLPEGLSFTDHPDAYDPDYIHHLKVHLDGKHIGGMTWNKRAAGGFGKGEIMNIGVSRNYQRRGIASELLRRARQITPEVHHSDDLSDDARAWAAKTAGANGNLPEGLTFHHLRPGDREDDAYPFFNPTGIEHALRAEHEGQPIGQISWLSQAPSNNAAPKGRITRVQVHGDYRRKGLATELLRRAREIEPSVQHSPHLTEDGGAWVEKTAGLFGPSWYETAHDDEIDAHPAAEQIRGYMTHHTSPQGHVYRLTHDSSKYVTATYLGKGNNRIKKPQKAGYLTYFGGQANDQNNIDGRIHKVFVKPAHRRRGLASAMLDHARAMKKPGDDIEHSSALSEDGKAWSEKKAAIVPRGVDYAAFLRHTAMPWHNRNDGVDPSHAKSVRHAGYAGYVGDSEMDEELGHGHNHEEFDENLWDHTTPEPTHEEERHYEEHGEYPDSHHERHEQAYQDAVDKKHDEDRMDHDDPELHAFIGEHGDDTKLWHEKATFGKVSLTGPVYATQSHVNQEHIDRYRADPGGESHKMQSNERYRKVREEHPYLADKHPMFVTHQGRLHVTDGHHRVAAALQDGKRSIVGWHYDGDKHGLPGYEDDDEDDYHTASRRTASSDWNITREYTPDGGSKFGTRYTLSAKDANGEEQGWVRYHEPKRKGSPIHVEEVRGSAPGAASHLLNHMESLHPEASRTEFLGEKNTRHKNTPSHHDGEHGKPTDWDQHYDSLGDIHRGFAVRLDSRDARQINSPDHPAADHVKTLLGKVSESNAGIHWTSGLQEAKNFSQKHRYDPRTDIPVILHAQRPERKDIETRPNELFRNGVFPHSHIEKEVPVRRGREVQLTGISWKPDSPHPEADEDGWLHHTFDQPITKRARLSSSGYLDLYHRTTPEAADSIVSSGGFTSKEHRHDGQPVYFSTHLHGGEGEGYGSAAVHVRIPERLADLDDEFPNGEQHYAVPSHKIRPEHIVGRVASSMAIVEDDPARWGSDGWRAREMKRSTLRETHQNGEYTYHHAPGPLNDDEEGYGNIYVTHGDDPHNVVGESYYGPHPGRPGSLELASRVAPEHRRKGVATGMYDFAERLTGKPTAPADSNSEQAQGFWKDRLQRKTAASAEHRRQGVATAMLAAAHAAGASPTHSTARSDAGDAWARSVGGDLPGRTSSPASAFFDPETMQHYAAAEGGLPEGWTKEPGKEGSAIKNVYRHADTGTTVYFPKNEQHHAGVHLPEEDEDAYIPHVHNAVRKTGEHGVTFMVDTGHDKYFRATKSQPQGRAGGYVSSDDPDTVRISPHFIRSDIARGVARHAEANKGYFTPSIGHTDYREYTAVHELGHMHDFRNRHIDEEKRPGSGVFNKTKPIEAAFFRGQRAKSNLSAYGGSSTSEGYAEAFAHHHLRHDDDQSRASTVADRYAGRYGWNPRKEA